MERRIAQVFEVEATVPDESVDESVDASTPTTVLSAAPLQACVRASAPTVRQVALGRLPGKPLGTQPPAARRAQVWAIEEPLETAPVGAIPMPGELASAAVSGGSPQEMRAFEPSSGAVTAGSPQEMRAFAPSSAAMTAVSPRAMRSFDLSSAGSPRDRAWESSSAAVTMVAVREDRTREPSSAPATGASSRDAEAQAGSRAAETMVTTRDDRPRVAATTDSNGAAVAVNARGVRERSSEAATVGSPRAVRAGEPPLQYSVEREVSALAKPRAAAPGWQRRERRSAHVMVLIIGMLAGFMTMLGIVVVRQQRDLQVMADPALRANEVCAAYAGEVRAIALELTEAAGNVADVEKRIGERARSAVGDRAMQRLCAAPIAVACSLADAGCVASTLMQLRQALARR